MVFLEAPYHCDLMGCSVSPETPAAACSLCCITSLSPLSSHRVILEPKLNASCEMNSVVAHSWVMQILKDTCQAQWLTTAPTTSNFNFRLRYLAHKSHLHWDEIPLSSGFLDPRAMQTAWPKFLDVNTIALAIKGRLPRRIPCMQASLIAMEIFDMTMVSRTTDWCSHNSLVHSGVQHSY